MGSKDASLVCIRGENPGPLARRNKKNTPYAGFVAKEKREKRKKKREKEMGLFGLSATMAKRFSRATKLGRDVYIPPSPPPSLSLLTASGQHGSCPSTKRQHVSLKRAKTKPKTTRPRRESAGNSPPSPGGRARRLARPGAWRPGAASNPPGRPSGRGRAGCPRLRAPPPGIWKEEGAVGRGQQEKTHTAGA